MLKIWQKCNKKAAGISGFLTFVRKLRSNSACYLAGTKTTGAGVDVARRPCYNSLYTLNVGFPSPIASTMGMGNLDSESDTLTTDVALSHDAAPP